MITLSLDLETCPACEKAPLVKVSRTQRQCNSCGFQAVYVSAADELEAQEREKPRELVTGREIGRFAQRW